MEFSPTLPGPKWLRKRIGDEYFVSVAEAFFDKPSHRVLDDASFAELIARLRSQALPMPRGIAFSDLPITDVVMKELGRFSDITSLHIVNCSGVTDAGLKHINTLKRLRRLDLKGSSITDRGLLHLSNMTELKELRLSDTSV